MPAFKIILTSRAIKEIQHAVDYYNSQQNGLGKRFYADLKQRISSIKKHPFACAIRYDDIRFALLDKFPYAAHYAVEENAIVVYGVLSTHQDPETSWIKRKK